MADATDLKHISHSVNDRSQKDLQTIHNSLRPNLLAILQSHPELVALVMEWPKLTGEQRAAVVGIISQQG